MDAERSAYEVRVAVDKPGQHQSPAGLDLAGLARQREILQSPAGPNVVYAPVDNQNRAVLNEAEVPESGPAAGTAGSAQRKELPGTPDQGGLGIR